MTTLEHILHRYNLHTDYIEIPNIGRDDLAGLLHELRFQDGVEIGVANGEYSQVLLDANPQMTLYGVDPWVPYPGYRDYQKESTFEKMYQNALKIEQKYYNYEIIKDFSSEAVKMFLDESLDFVYLDGNHSGESVTEDMTIWTPKLKEGGIMAGHDFTGRFPALKNAVKKYCQDNDKQLFVLGLEAKDVPLKRDTSRTWLFVK